MHRILKEIICITGMEIKNTSINFININQIKFQKLFSELP